MNGMLYLEDAESGLLCQILKIKIKFHIPVY